MAQVKMAQVAK